MFTGVKVFSATKAKEREDLGEQVTRWLRANGDLEIVDRTITQSLVRLASRGFLPITGRGDAPLPTCLVENVAAGVLRAPGGNAGVRPLAPFAQEILSAGGVVAYLREHGDFPSVA